MRSGVLAKLFAILVLAATAAVPALAADLPVCASCHEKAHTTTALTAHGYKNDPSGAMCQACHGDASAHIKDPVANKPANVLKHGTPAEKTAVCMTCHTGSRHLAFWEAGKHARNDVTCANCHWIHGGQGEPRISQFQTTFRPNEVEVCGTCHQQVRAATLKPSHHPIQEGKVQCSNCHNPHGALTQVMLRHETVNQQCYSCHAEKRGPFVFGHPPVDENCLTCHTPHGSTHGKLLNEKVPNLCQDCHVQGKHPTSYYGQNQAWLLPNGTPNSSPSTRMVARACLNCHNNIHGSNAPSSRGKAFIR